MLIDAIRGDRVRAKMNKDKIAATALTTLLGELENTAKRTGEEISNDLVISVVTKMRKSITETLDALNSTFNQETFDAYTREYEVYGAYLPTMLTKDQLIDTIKSSGAANLGDAMKHLKQNYNGQYDGKEASSIAREMFA